MTAEDIRKEIVEMGENLLLEFVKIGLPKTHSGLSDITNTTRATLRAFLSPGAKERDTSITTKAVLQQLLEDYFFENPQHNQKQDEIIGLIEQMWAAHISLQAKTPSR